MAKIWEVNYTVFSGVSNVAFDAVGTQHLTSETGIIKTATPLPDLSIRKGVSFVVDNTIQFYNLTSGSVTNAQYRSGWSSARSYVCWIYNKDNLMSGWDSNADDSIWAAVDASDVVLDGFFVEAVTNKKLAAKINGTSYHSAVDSQGWHLMVLTVDKGATQSKFYVDNVLVQSVAAVVGVAAPSAEVIGSRLTTKEGNFYLGYTATYDEILTSGQINTIYNTFLKDTNALGNAINTLSGTLYNTPGVTVSGAYLYAIHQDTGKVESSGVSSGNGEFALELPFSGGYAITAISGSSMGSASLFVSATSSGVTVL